MPRGGVAKIFLKEPPGLTIGKVRLDDGSAVLGRSWRDNVRSRNTEAGAYITAKKVKS